MAPPIDVEARCWRRQQRHRTMMRGRVSAANCSLCSRAALCSKPPQKKASASGSLPTSDRETTQSVLRPLRSRLCREANRAIDSPLGALSRCPGPRCAVGTLRAHGCREGADCAAVHRFERALPAWPSIASRDAVVRCRCAHDPGIQHVPRSATGIRSRLCSDRAYCIRRVRRRDLVTRRSTSRGDRRLTRVSMRQTSSGGVCESRD